MKIKLLYLSLLALLALMVSSCNRHEEQLTYVHDRDKGYVEVHTGPSPNEGAIARWDQYTHVNLEKANGRGARGFVYVSNSDTGEKGWIHERHLYRYSVPVKEVRNANGTVSIYADMRSQRLRDAGATWSAWIMDRLERLEFQKPIYNESLWTWLWVGAGLVVTLLFFGFMSTTDEEVWSKIFYFLMWGALAFMLYAEYVVFVIHSPIDANSQGIDDLGLPGLVEFLINLVLFVLILYSMYLQLVSTALWLGTLMPGGGDMAENSDMVVLNLVIIFIPLLIWCVMVAFAAAWSDYALWVVLGLHGCYCLYLLYMGIARGGFFPVLLYIPISVVVVSVLLFTLLTLGATVGIFAAIVCSLLSPVAGPRVIVDDTEYSLRNAYGQEVARGTSSELWSSGFSRNSDGSWGRRW